MALWIPITLVAAFLQNIRSGLQRHLKARMGTTGATFVRFGFGAPFVLALLAVLHFGLAVPMPVFSARFFLWAAVGGLSQIAATFLLVHLFSLRNFAAGTAYSRTEPVMAALFGYVLLGEPVAGATLAAIAICSLGVMCLSVARSDTGIGGMVATLGQRSTGIGLTSGVLFGLSAVSYRAASQALAGPTVLMQGTVTLAVVITGQALLMLGLMALRDPGELRRVAQAWRPALLVGLAGASASLGWFTAMTLQPAGTVKALAQVEMLFTLTTSALIFREQINRRELMGCGLVVAGLLVLVLWR